MAVIPLQPGKIASMPGGRYVTQADGTVQADVTGRNLDRLVLVTLYRLMDGPGPGAWPVSNFSLPGPVPFWWIKFAVSLV